MAEAPLLTRPFLLASASHFLHCLSFNLYLHLPGFLQGLGASEVGIGVLFGMTALTAVLLRPAMGWIMDRRGRRTAIVLGGVVHAVICTLYLTTGSMGPWLYGIRLVHGVAEAMLFTSLFAYATDIVPSGRRIEGIALFGVSGMLPMSIGGVLGDAILAGGSYDELFAISAGFSLVGLLLSLPLREAERAAGEPPRGILAAARQRDLLPLWSTGLAFALAISSYFAFMKTFVLARGAGSVGLFFTCYSLAAIGLRVGFGRLPDRVGPKRALFPALGSLAVGLALLAHAESAAIVGVAGVLAGLGHGFIFPILLGLVVARARPTERGAAMALFTALFDGGMLLGGPAFGALVRGAGYDAMFLAAAGLVAAAAVAFALWDRRVA